MDISKSNRIVTTLRIDSDIKKAVDYFKTDHNMSMSDVIEKALLLFFDDHICEACSKTRYYTGGN